MTNLSLTSTTLISAFRMKNRSVFQPDGIAPGLSRRDLTRPLEFAIARIDTAPEIEEPRGLEQLKQYTAAFAYLRAQTSPYLANGNAAGALPAYCLTTGSLLTLIAELFPEHTDEDAKENTKAGQRLKGRIRALEIRLSELEPRTVSLDDMVSRIESAYAAADDLPVDLADLAKAKEEISGLLTSAQNEHVATQTATNKHKGNLEAAVETGAATLGAIKNQLSQSEGLVDQLAQLHRIGTSTVLAGAFNARAKQLNSSVYVWLVVLMIALGAASFIGHEKANVLTGLLGDPSVSTGIIFLQSLLMLLGMGAPIWLGWVSTKQIGQRFKLAEDYHYKASISNAYEGYRREAVDLDDDFRRQLFQSALGRLDEQPLRVMDIENHGSPIHEAISRPGFWSFMIQVFGRNGPSPSKSHAIAATSERADAIDRVD